MSITSGVIAPRLIQTHQLQGAAIELVYTCVCEPGDPADYAGPDERGIVWRTGTQS